MSFREDLVTYMDTDATLTGLISTRRFPQFAPQDTIFPYITFLKLTSESILHTSAVTSIVPETWQFNIWGEKMAQIDPVEEALRELFDGYAGPMGSTTVRETKITGIVDSSELPSDGTQKGPFETIMNINFWYLRSVPTF